MSAQLEHISRYGLGLIEEPMPDALWQELEPKFARAMEVAGPWNTADLRREIERGDAWMLVVFDLDQPRTVTAAVACTVDAWRDRKVLTVIAAAGADFDGWIDQVQDALEFHVKRTECDAIRAICRPGMGRWLRQHDYRPTAEIMEWIPSWVD